MDLAKIDSCAERDKYVIIILDEMHIREDIVYDKHTGTGTWLWRIYMQCGMHTCIHPHLHTCTHVCPIANYNILHIHCFRDLGNVNNHLLDLEKTVAADDEEKQEVAKSIMVVMVRGLFNTFINVHAVAERKVCWLP